MWEADWGGSKQAAGFVQSATYDVKVMDGQQTSHFPSLPPIVIKDTLHSIAIFK